jgi:hypothetical protein
MDLKGISMDRNRHFTKTARLSLHFALLCVVLCLSGGCEEAMVDGPPIGAGPEPAVTVADLAVVTEAIENALAEMVCPSPEEAAEAEPVVIAVEETAKAGPVGAVVRQILAESAQPMPEEASEKEAAAELAERIGLEYPIPALSLELGAAEPDAAADLDKMHIADASLLAEDAKPAQGHEEIQPAKQEAGSRGFAAKFVVTPCNAVAGFAMRHGFISGVAVVFVAGLIITNKKKLSFSGLWRRMNPGR